MKITHRLKESSTSLAGGAPFSTTPYLLPRTKKLRTATGRPTAVVRVRARPQSAYFRNHLTSSGVHIFAWPANFRNFAPKPCIFSHTTPVRCVISNKRAYIRALARFSRARDGDRDFTLTDISLSTLQSRRTTWDKSREIWRIATCALEHAPFVLYPQSGRVGVVRGTLHVLLGCAAMRFTPCAMSRAEAARHSSSRLAAPSLASSSSCTSLRFQISVTRVRLRRYSSSSALSG